MKKDDERREKTKLKHGKIVERKTFRPRRGKTLIQSRNTKEELQKKIDTGSS